MEFLNHHNYPHNKKNYSPLKLKIFKKYGDNVISGLFKSEEFEYPIVDGIPRFVSNNNEVGYEPWAVDSNGNKYLARDWEMRFYDLTREREGMTIDMDFEYSPNTSFFANYLFSANEIAIGLFLGTSIHETAQVAGAGLIYLQQFSSSIVLKTATATKLIRNFLEFLLFPVLFLLALPQFLFLRRFP